MNDRARYVARVAYETADEAFCRWPLGVSRRCEIEIFEETKVQKVQCRRTSTNCSKYKKKSYKHERGREKDLIPTRSVYNIYNFPYLSYQDLIYQTAVLSQRIEFDNIQSDECFYTHVAGNRVCIF